MDRGELKELLIERDDQWRERMNALAKGWETDERIPALAVQWLRMVVNNPLDPGQLADQIADEWDAQIKT